MLNNLKKIAELLPDGLSESTLESIVALCSESVQFEVDAEIKVLEAKVDGFLRGKISQLKETARKELESDNEILREARKYRTLRKFIAEDIETSDIDSVVSESQEEVESLEGKITELNSKLESALRENRILGDKTSVLKEENQKLSIKSKLPAKLRESAVVINNNPDEEGVKPETSDNPFLTEQMLNLARN